MNNAIDEATPGTSWAGWMRGMGRNTRTMREFLGLTQEQLGKLAGVSQGAISRLESGRGMATPLLVVMKVHHAFRRALSAIPPDLLSDDARRIVEDDTRLITEGGTSDYRDIPVLNDPALQEYVQIYQSVPEHRRDTFLTVVRAAAGAISDQSDGAGLAKQA
jgi:transcriptional regulator with XRE-family HTH domain